MSTLFAFIGPSKGGILSNLRICDRFNSYINTMYDLNKEFYNTIFLLRPNCNCQILQCIYAKKWIIYMNIVKTSFCASLGKKGLWVFAIQTLKQFIPQTIQIKIHYVWIIN